MNERGELPARFALPAELLSNINQHTYLVADGSPPKVTSPERVLAPAPVGIPSGAYGCDRDDRDAVDRDVRKHNVSQQASAAATSDQQTRFDVPHDLQPKSSKPSYYWTWRLLSAGFRVEECCEIRRLSPAAIVREAVDAVNNGHPLDVRWVLTQEEISALEAEASSITGQQQTVQTVEDEHGLTASRRRLFQTCLQQSLVGKSKK
jgi:hypothetical protein